MLICANRDTNRNKIEILLLLLALLGFDDDYTLYKQMYFQRLYAGRYPVVIKIVDSAYDLVYEHVLVKGIQ